MFVSVKLLILLQSPYPIIEIAGSSAEIKDPIKETVSKPVRHPHAGQYTYSVSRRFRTGTLNRKIFLLMAVYNTGWQRFHKPPAKTLPHPILNLLRARDGKRQSVSHKNLVVLIVIGIQPQIVGV